MIQEHVTESSDHEKLVKKMGFLNWVLKEVEFDEVKVQLEALISLFKKELKRGVKNNIWQSSYIWRVLYKCLNNSTGNTYFILSLYWGPNKKCAYELTA